MNPKQHYPNQQFTSARVQLAYLALVELYGTQFALTQELGLAKSAASMWKRKNLIPESTVRHMELLLAHYTQL